MSVWFGNSFFNLNKINMRSWSNSKQLKIKDRKKKKKKDTCIKFFERFQFSIYRTVS